MATLLGYFPFFILTSLISPSFLITAQHFDAIYQFGDSFADTGNLLIQNGKLGSCGRFPYGENFFHQPTGRCSNGRLIVDFIAKALKLPFPNPYLAKGADFTHGVNFAVGGATALDAITLGRKGINSPITNYSLSAQLGWFKSHLKTICSSEADCKPRLSNALFRVGEIGGNDFNFAIMQGKSQDEITHLGPEVIQNIVNTIKELVSLGAKYLVVPGNFPIGCIPLYLANAKTRKGYDRLGCLKGPNIVCKMYNEQLQEAISKLQKEYSRSTPGVRVVYADYYNALIWLIQNAKSLGFEEKDKFKTCCGRGDNVYNMGVQINCAEDGSTVCSDPRKLISWDGVHPTQKAFYYMVKHWLMKDIMIADTLNNSRTGMIDQGDKYQFD